MAGRAHFYDTILRKHPDTGMAEPLEDVAVEVVKILEDGTDDPVSPIVYTGRKTMVAVTVMQTDEEGEIDFWLDPGDYNITFSDTITPPRINPKLVGFSSTPGAPNGMLRSQLPDYGRGLFDSGDIKLSGKAGDHAGWLLCDGRSVTVVAQPKLFDAIGYTYGGSGANFSLPDLRDAVALGPGNMGTGRGDRNVIAASTALGAMLGVPTVSLTEDYLPAHTHPHDIAVAVAITAVGNHAHGGMTGGMNGNDPHWHGVHPDTRAGTTILHDHLAAFGNEEAIRIAKPADSTSYYTARGIGGVASTSIAHGHGIGVDGGHGHDSTATVSGTVNANTVAGSNAPKVMDNIPPATVVNYFIKL